MIKFTAQGHERPLFGIGLSFGNLDKFRAQPGDTFIKIEGPEIDLPFDVIIFSGRTEAELAEMMMQFIGPDTKLHIAEKLKS